MPTQHYLWLLLYLYFFPNPSSNPQNTLFALFTIFVNPCSFRHYGLLPAILIVFAVAIIVAHNVTSTDTYTPICSTLSILCESTPWTNNLLNSNKGVKPHLLFSRCLCIFGYTFSGWHSGGETAGQLLLFFRFFICCSFYRFLQKMAAQLVARGRESVIVCGRRGDPLIAFYSQ